MLVCRATSRSLLRDYRKTTFQSIQQPCFPRQRRHFIRSLGEGFLDLAVALPLPTNLPTYSSTIIIVTVLTRFCLLPVAIWGKKRAWRIEEYVIPELERAKPAIYQGVLKQMKAQGIRGDKKQIQAIHGERSTALLTDLRKQLYKKHKCGPLTSILVPTLSQLPVFVISSMVLSRLSIAPTPFDSESFLTLTTLAHPDPTMALPIILGMITMANVESSNWVMTAAERERQQRLDEVNAKRIAEGGKPTIQPNKLLKSGLRLLSVGRIIFAAVMPGSVTLYWVTSAVFGLFQTWGMDWWDMRRKQKRLVKQPNGRKSATSARR
ncbi:hypothetical protein BDN71DRAFT_1447556 [Pleurotus eryngii]|uniref:Membrane insertase YidC/Oxa/ALB C-terminal domain-containing protein n=1 Tax=Pleurotus eryngii TaxID=5323 RepID=A0A9P6DG38_PLEER|nr:hypothetical protein BDN71DRAFT_1447556 [Pleurotus eryngii]